ncbi:MAG: UDP-glucose 4-epimerase GalE [Lachnospiraceae bacterium]|nr:UDP-glucose 4-epimerase GalE [Lachnospiraceae bacterium]
MAVLLAGGAGYIGTHTAVAFADAGYDVVIADNLYNAKASAVQRVRELTGKDIPLYRIDVCDVEAVRKVFRENDIDTVVHFAGLKAVGESVAKPLTYYRNNLDATLTLLEVMKEFGCHRIVFSSSATVYGAAETMPLYETTPRGACTNPYGWTKWMIEQILFDAAHADPELSAAILRYFNPIGAHESGMIGEDPQGVPNNIFPYITQIAVGRRPLLTLYGTDYDTPDGTCIRDYIHIVDLAKGHVAAAEYAAREKGAEVFNLGTGKGTSVLEIVEAFERVNGVKIPRVNGERRPGDAPINYANADKAARLLGWHAERTLEDMCRDGYRWQTMNPQGYPDEEKQPSEN